MSAANVVWNRPPIHQSFKAFHSGCSTPNAWLNDHCQIPYPPRMVAPPAISEAVSFCTQVSRTFLRRTRPMSTRPRASTIRMTASAPSV